MLRSKLRPSLAAVLLLFLGSSASPARAAETPSTRELARRVFEEIFSQGRVSLIDETYAPDFVDDSRGGGSTPELIRKAVAGWRTACPDLHIAVDDEIAEGDMVVVRWTATGTQTGEFNGLPPTGKHVKVTGLSLFHVAHGKIDHEWTQLDRLGLYEQLGFSLRPPGS